MDDKFFILRTERPYIMGISIIAVFLFHIVSFSNIYRGFNFNILTYGYLGVDAFFVLSTYGLCFSYEKHSKWKFYLNRIKRIFPLYFIFLIIVFLVFKEPDELYKSLLYQTTGLSIVKSLNTDVEWYTPSLIATYISFPFFYYIGKILQNKSIWMNVIAINIIAIIAYKLMPFIHILYLTRLPIILSGIIIYFLYKNNRNHEVLQFILILLAESFVLNRHTLSMVTLLLIWIFKYFHYKPYYKIISLIGKYSYELYLSQVLTTLYYMKISTIENIYIMICVTIIVTVPISLIFILINNISNLFISQRKKL